MQIAWTIFPLEIKNNFSAFLLFIIGRFTLRCWLLCWQNLQSTLMYNNYNICSIRLPYLLLKVLILTLGYHFVSVIDTIWKKRTTFFMPSEFIIFCNSQREISEVPIPYFDNLPSGSVHSVSCEAWLFPCIWRIGVSTFERKLWTIA